MIHNFVASGILLRISTSIVDDFVFLNPAILQDMAKLLQLGIGFSGQPRYSSSRCNLHSGIS